MPPLPSRAMMRYRLASRRPGRKRPSFSRYSAELGGRDAEDEGAGRAEECDGEGGAKSMVARSSGLLPGVPQDEQKRPGLGSREPPVVQGAMFFPDPFSRARAKLFHRE